MTTILCAGSLQWVDAKGASGPLKPRGKSVARSELRYLYQYGVVLEGDIHILDNCFGAEYLEAFGNFEITVVYYPWIFYYQYLIGVSTALP